MRARLAAVIVAVALAGGGCADQSTHKGPADTPMPPVPDITAVEPTASGAPTGAGPKPDPVAAGRIDEDDRYLALATQLHRRGVEVWFDAALRKRWLEGPASLAEAASRLAALSRRVPTRGIRIVDELGYKDALRTPAEARRFLRDVRAALARYAPDAEVLVDVLVLELGCIPGRSGDACRNDARQQWPAATVAAVTGYLREGLIDRLDLSTGLLEPAVYESVGSSRDQAQQAAWRQVRALGWHDAAEIRARKALAGPEGYPGTTSEAAQDLRTYVDLPLAAGAQAVDIWTWRQNYAQGTAAILGPDLAPNALWTGLRERADKGVRLATHVTPSAMPEDPRRLAHECDLLAEVFSAVYVAAGTG